MYKNQGFWSMLIPWRHKINYSMLVLNIISRHRQRALEMLSALNSLRSIIIHMLENDWFICFSECSMVYVCTGYASIMVHIVNSLHWCTVFILSPVWKCLPLIDGENPHMYQRPGGKNSWSYLVTLAILHANSQGSNPGHSSGKPVLCKLSLLDSQNLFKCW